MNDLRSKITIEQFDFAWNIFGGFHNAGVYTRDCLCECSLFEINEFCIDWHAPFLTLFHSWHCSMICLNVQIWSLQYVPFRKAACSLRISASMADDKTNPTENVASDREKSPIVTQTMVSFL